MSRKIISFKKICLIPAFILLLLANNHLFGQGNLVIVGGGLEHNNQKIFTQLLELAGGTEKATFAVIPSASGVAMQSFVSFQKALISYGVKPENIHLIKIAMADDDSTSNVDESAWRNNGNDAGIAKLVSESSAVWFTGGDQLRTMKTLVNPDGSNTLVLDAVWEVFHSGGVIGGTSAGAAIMSKAMIGGGNSLGALTNGVITNYQGDDFPEGDGLLMSKGLGFFPAGIVDQHFNQRARIGRLIIALMSEKTNYQIGFGIDENTALIYFSKQNTAKIAGAGGVTIINTANAKFAQVDNLPIIENLSVSYLENDDVYDISSGKITPAPDKKATRGNEYYNIKNPGQTGILSAHSDNFRDLITINLIDNKGADSVQNISFYEKKSGFLVTLFKTDFSEGYYTDKPDDIDHYTVTNIGMNIVPIQLNVAPLKTLK